MTAEAIIRAGAAQDMLPHPRYLLDDYAWRAMADLARDLAPALVGLWADTAHVHALFAGGLMASVRVKSGSFHPLSPTCPAAAPFERMIHELWGHGAAGRPLLDPARWPVLRPLSARPMPAPAPDPDEPAELPDGLHRLTLGPFSADGPAELRLALSGERVVAADTRPGPAHRGVLALLRGKPVRAAARIAGRIAGDATVAHATAFARAVEAASGAEPPPRAQALRAAMLALERIAVHLDALAGLLPGVMAARCADVREDVVQACGGAFGHRLMMDRVVPGGVAADLTPDGAVAVLEALDAVAALLPGVLRKVDAMDGGPGMDARLRRRIAGLRSGIGVVPEWLATLPPGPIDAPVETEASGEGLGMAVGPQGEVWHWLRLDAGTVATAFACDPAWLLWPAMEAACVGADAAAVPGIVRSFGASVAGMAL